jgi:hypothetical protein
MVRFKENFSYHDLKLIIHHDLFVPEGTDLHNIWLIGKHHAQIRMGELLSIVDDFKFSQSFHVKDKKTAIVVEQGLTEAIMQLLADGLQKELSYKCRVFHTLEKAQEWLGLKTSKVA